MISKEQLAIFERYNGDGDIWARVNDAHEHKIMADQDFWDINFILQDLTALKNGLCAKDYEIDIRRRLKEMSENEEVEARLMTIA